MSVNANAILWGLGAICAMSGIVTAVLEALWSKETEKEELETKRSKRSSRDSHEEAVDGEAPRKSRAMPAVDGAAFALAPVLSATRLNSRADFPGYRGDLDDDQDERDERDRRELVVPEQLNLSEYSDRPDAR